MNARNIPGFGPAFVNALQGLAGLCADDDVKCCLSEMEFDRIVEDHQLGATRLRNLGFDMEPVALCLESGKITAVFVSRLTKRVADGDVSVKEVNLALWRFNSSVNARSLHRDIQLLEVIGFDVDALTTLIAAGKMNGTSVRSLLHRVCSDGLLLDDANTALVFNASEVLADRRQAASMNVAA